jgi:hypothetical protein
MRFDIEDRLREGEHAHPRASRLLNEGSDVLWSVDVGPLNSDRGHDAFAEYPSWRAEHPDEGLDACLHGILGQSWGVSYGPELLEAETIRRQIEEDEQGQFDFHQDVYTLDETVIATALAHLIYEGSIDESAKSYVRFAVERQLHPLVLGRLFDGDAREARMRSLREVLRLLDAAGDAPKGEKRRAAKGRAKRSEDVCPWPVGGVFVRRLPSGKRFVLHLFGKNGETPVFYVLEWSAEDLPAQGAPLEAIDIRPSKDLWKFSLPLPVAHAGEDLEDYRRRLETVLVPTGLTKTSKRATIPCTVVFWDGLDAYLAKQYD